MSDAKPPTKAEVLPMLANGINNALVGTLVVALPSDDPQYVELSTITGITDPDRLNAVAHHIADLSQMHRQKEQGLDEKSDVDGHA
jgi:hypothetical protein